MTIQEQAPVYKVGTHEQVAVMEIGEQMPSISDVETIDDNPEESIRTVRKLGKGATRVSQLTREDIVDNTPSTD